MSICIPLSSSPVALMNLDRSTHHGSVAYPSPSSDARYHVDPRRAADMNAPPTESHFALPPQARPYLSTVAGHNRPPPVPQGQYDSEALYATASSSPPFYFQYHPPALPTTARQHSPASSPQAARHPSTQYVHQPVHPVHVKSLVPAAGPATDRRPSSSASKKRGGMGAWTEAEDAQLVQLVRQFGTKNWVSVERAMQGRDKKQCRERWCNHVNPHINDSPFTEAESIFIIDCYVRHGRQWARMSRCPELQNRPDNAIKNHFNTNLRDHYAELCRLHNVPRRQPNDLQDISDDVYERIKGRITAPLSSSMRGSKSSRFVANTGTLNDSGASSHPRAHDRHAPASAAVGDGDTHVSKTFSRTVSNSPGHTPSGALPFAATSPSASYPRSYLDSTVGYGAAASTSHHSMYDSHAPPSMSAHYSAHQPSPSVFESLHSLRPASERAHVHELSKDSATSRWQDDGAEASFAVKRRLRSPAEEGDGRSRDPSQRAEHLYSSASHYRHAPPSQHSARPLTSSSSASSSSEHKEPSFSRPLLWNSASKAEKEKGVIHLPPISASTPLTLSPSTTASGPSTLKKFALELPPRPSRPSTGSSLYETSTHVAMTEDELPRKRARSRSDLDAQHKTLLWSYSRHSPRRTTNLPPRSSTGPSTTPGAPAAALPPRSAGAASFVPRQSPYLSSAPIMGGEASGEDRRWAGVERASPISPPLPSALWGTRTADADFRFEPSHPRSFESDSSRM